MYHARGPEFNTLQKRTTTKKRFILRNILNWAVVAHAFNPALRRQRQEDLCEFEASLYYRASSRTARATQKNPFSKNQKKKKKQGADGKWD